MRCWKPRPFGRVVTHSFRPTLEQMRLREALYQALIPLIQVRFLRADVEAQMQHELAVATETLEEDARRQLCAINAARLWPEVRQVARAATSSALGQRKRKLGDRYSLSQSPADESRSIATIVWHYLDAPIPAGRQQIDAAARRTAATYDARCYGN
jgi:hypothetical protein